MGNVSTKSICPFPYKFPESIDPSNGTIEDCDIVYAETLDPGWLILQLVNLIFYIGFAVPVFIVRIYQVREYFKHLIQDFKTSTQFKVYSLGLSISVLAIITNIDPFGFRDWLPIEVYYIGDNLIGALFFALALLILEFWARTARLLHSLKFGVFIATFATVVGITLVSFLALLLLAIFLPAYFFLFEGIKLLGGAFILLYIFIVVVFSIRKIVRTLDPTFSTDSITIRQIFACKYPEYLTQTEVSVMTLKKKYYMWCMVLLASILILIYSALESFGFDYISGESPADWEWGYDINDQPDYVTQLVHFIYMFALLLLLRFFEVPKIESIAITRRTTLDVTQDETTPKRKSDLPPRRVSKVIIATGIGVERQKSDKEITAELKTIGKAIAAERKNIERAVAAEKKLKKQASLAEKRARRKTLKLNTAETIEGRNYGSAISVQSIASAESARREGSGSSFGSATSTASRLAEAAEISRRLTRENISQRTSGVGRRRKTLRKSQTTFANAESSRNWAKAVVTTDGSKNEVSEDKEHNESLMQNKKKDANKEKRKAQNSKSEGSKRNLERQWE